MMLDEIIKRIHNLTHKQQKDAQKNLGSIPKEGKREYSRLSTKLDIDAVIDKDKLIHSETGDISASGVYIKTGTKLETGKRARVIFSIPRTFKILCQLTES